MTLRDFMWAVAIFDASMISLIVLAVITSSILERIDKYKHRNDPKVSLEEAQRDPGNAFYLADYLRKHQGEK